MHCVFKRHALFCVTCNAILRKFTAIHMQAKLKSKFRILEHSASSVRGQILVDVVSTDIQSKISLGNYNIVYYFSDLLYDSIL